MPRDTNGNWIPSPPLTKEQRETQHKRLVEISAMPVPHWAGLSTEDQLEYMRGDTKEEPCLK